MERLSRFYFYYKVIGCEQIYPNRKKNGLWKTDNTQTIQIIER